MTEKQNPNALKHLFLFDFFCALFGAVLYFFLLDFMVDDLGLPRWLAQFQLTANFLYALYGLILFVKKAKQLTFYKFLTILNFIYAGFCALMGVILILNHTYLGTVLLLTEGLLIALLAKVEWVMLTKSPSNTQAT